MTNYVSNALHHLDGEKIVEIKVQKQENRVKVTVFNTGTPIPEADLPNLWNKFYKVDKARTREYGGSGIGLSIVKAIMEGMNQQYGVQKIIVIFHKKNSVNLERQYKLTKQAAAWN